MSASGMRRTSASESPKKPPRLPANVRAASASSAIIGMKIVDERTIASGSRPAARASLRTKSTLRRNASSVSFATSVGRIVPARPESEITFTMSAVRAAIRRRPLPLPPSRIGGRGFWTGFGALNASCRW